MLKKRIIPCLDIKEGRTVKGINFESIRDAGDPIALAKRYVDEGADELVFLDITATIEQRKTLIDLVRQVANVINIPFTVGGGIHTLADVKALIDAGADKVSINSAAVNNPDLITSIASVFGSQCIVLAIDTMMHKDGNWYVYVNGGRVLTDYLALDWAIKAEQLGAGEILLTSMNGDGTKNGYSLNITQAISTALQIPVIASGGAGKRSHFKDLFEATEASAALAASVFHYKEILIPDLKYYLQSQEIPMRIVASQSIHTNTILKP